MESSVLDITDQNAKQNTRFAYNPKSSEFRQFCDYKYKNLPKEKRYHIDNEKVYMFMWYQSFREKKPQGGKKRKYGEETMDVGADEEQEISGAFNIKEFDTLVQTHNNRDSSRGQQEVQEPQNGIGLSVFRQYKAAIRGLYEREVAEQRTSLPWDFVWTEPCQKLKEMVQSRRPRQKKKNHQEKVDFEISPWLAVNEISKVEEALFNSGKHRTCRQAFASLRNRYCFLQTYGGILRAESVFNAELSDLLGCPLQLPTDPHQVFVFIMQLAEGKTNDGIKLYGRLTRHKDVLLCGGGALAFYLLYRFFVTGEMDEPPDFTSNTAWFDIKLLVDSQANDFTKAVKNTTYADAMKAVLKDLEIPSDHYLHFGRVMGAIDLERLERESDEVRQLGNWDPKTQEVRYSTKLPMKAIRAKAGFHQAGGMYFNTRTVVEPPESLRKCIFPWLEESLKKVRDFNASQERRVPCKTALQFLKLLDYLRTVALQDAASMLELYPERCGHPLFQLPVFRCNEFSEFRAKMKAALRSEQVPFDAQLHAVLPGLQERVSFLTNEQKRYYEMMMEQNRLGQEKQMHHMANLMTYHFQQQLHTVGSLFHQMGSTMQHSELQLQPFSAPNHSNGTGLQPQPFLSPFSAHTLNHSNGRPGTSGELRDEEQESNAPLLSTTIPPGYGHKPSKVFSSVKTLYQEWYGLGPFEGVPISGGIDALETRYKTSWRQGFSSAETQHFSRSFRVIKAIKFMEETKGISTEASIAELEQVFMASKKKLSTFVEKLKREGLLPTKGNAA